MIGVEDLDENGVWMALPGYGQVWSPNRVPAGWAPYHFGRWAWVEPWGWTWIDDAPWGFAPFHYGRWAFLQSRWVWIPGTIVARPVYAPALVVFVGGGDPDQVGWFPLGPQEVYVPPYQVSTAYVQRLNITNVTNITVQVIERINVTQVVYANRTVSAAVTMVPRQSFLQSRPTSVSALPPSSFDARRAPVVGMSALIQPQRESVVGLQVNPQKPAPQPPQNIVTRRVYSRMTPAPAPQPFAPRDQAPTPPAGTAAPRQAPAQPQQRPVEVVTPLSRVPNPPPARTPAAQTPAAQTPAPQTPAPQTPAVQTPAVQTPGTRGGDSQSLIATMNSRTIPDAEKHLEDARKVKGIKLDYDGLRKQLRDIRTSLGAVQKTAASGKTDDAQKQLKGLQDQVAAIEKIIADAVKAAGGSGSDQSGGGDNNGGRQAPSKPSPGKS
jgi:hypothetical protein